MTSGTRQRPSIFGGEDDLDLSGFSPKGDSDKPHVPLETLERISEETGLPSRAIKPKIGTNLQPPLKRPVLTKSGRTVLLNARITQRAHSRFHEIVDVERARYERGEIMHRPTLGEVVELALAALERERQSERK